VSVDSPTHLTDGQLGALRDELDRQLAKLQRSMRVTNEALRPAATIPRSSSQINSALTRVAATSASIGLRPQETMSRSSVWVVHATLVPESVPMPMIMKAEKAAAIIKRGLAKNRPRIAFPLTIYFIAWLLGSLPPGLQLQAQAPEDGGTGDSKPWPGRS
jgi:hypothetical protein